MDLVLSAFTSLGVVVGSLGGVALIVGAVITPFIDQVSS